MKRDFNEWLGTFTDTIATWRYYTDFDKVTTNVDKIKVELNILNSLIGSNNIENEFRDIVKQYPQTLKAIPILLAKRDKEIKITDASKNYIFNFNNPNYSVDEYVVFMKKTGLFDMLQKHIIHSLTDYVLGVEVGMDTNGRKGRTGDAMEDLVETYIVKAGFVKDVSYFKEVKISTIEECWQLDLSSISNTGKTEKRFDFVVISNNTVYAIETNFYNSKGSKPNETARSYKNIATESKGIHGFKFVWFTDGKGWISSRHNLEEAFDVMDNIFNLNDLENDIISKVFK